jgi:hypothetical protein
MFVYCLRLSGQPAQINLSSTFVGINRIYIRWTSIDAVGKSGGVLVLRNDNNFRVNSIEYGGQWIAIFGVHSSLDFACAIVGVCAASSVL